MSKHETNHKLNKFAANTANNMDGTDSWIFPINLTKAWLIIEVTYILVLLFFSYQLLFLFRVLCKSSQNLTLGLVPIA